ncbi:hypothetical protein JQX13_09215 [Archangium violaceum]|uniref:RIO1 family regulatory kinase/ATPase domain-containing protein n=1 Tax=Archangium violaceum TaxID=83451 RepID=UPI00193AF93B|nr:RIO1 family regulatory kinase/ATPase [Archangium violaceum]QRK10251.1 hypothetical protein JQX13_09215 [Archangium violaceum]
MNEALQVLLTDGVIDEVVGRLKSGKEADVYLVRHGGEVVAAKIYKEREHRNFRNNSGYREGRQVRNSRTARAIAKGSRFGVQAAEDAWKTAEADALGKLYAAGVCVPRPVMFYEGVLLMELVLDLEGHPAPRLEEAALTPEEASALYFDLRNQAIRMLCCDLIHGDLSAFNILLGNRGATIIDFPQVVDAAANSQAEFFFKRDLENLRRYFEATDPSLRSRSGDAHEIWRAYVKRELTPDFVPTGRFQGEGGPRDRRFSGPRNGPGGGSGGGHPRGDRPQGERFPRGDRPQGERFEQRGDRPQGERFPRGERPQGERPPRVDGEGQRPWREQGARPSEPQGPREMRPRGDRPPPRGDRPRGERFPQGNGDGQRPWREQGARPSEQQRGQQQGPRGRPPEQRRDDGSGRGPRQGRGGGGPQVSYVQKTPAAPSPSPAKPDDES